MTGANGSVRTGAGVVAAVAAVVGVGAAATGFARMRDRTGSVDRAGNRWHWVTVDVPLDEADRIVSTEPIVAIGDRAEIAVRPAPGGRGTEVGIGPSELVEPDAARRALREAKQLVEVGEVLRVEPVHGRRPATPTGILVDALERRAGGVGLG